jgi:putative DNA primase/helicase
LGTEPVTLTPAESERLNTWMVDVASALVGSPPRFDGDQARFSNTGFGLSINRQRGDWFSHARGIGGISALKLIRLLRHEWSEEDIAQWALAFLAGHQGTGSALSDSDDADGGAAAAASEWLALQVLQDAQDPLGTVTETYLNGRELYAPFPPCVRHLANARLGEDAVVGTLTARGRIVGVQVGYIGPSGAKTTLPPKRRRFILERGLPGYFDIQDGDPRDPIALAEGLENSMSLRQVWPHRVWGIPGIAALTKLDATATDSFVIFRDGDAAGSAADRALQDGVDHLLLCGATVRVTQTPQEQDANSLLQDGKLEVVRELIEQAQLGSLSIYGEAQRLARLPREEYDRERKLVAKVHKVLVGTLDDLVKSTKAKAASKNSAAPPEEEAWDGPIDLCAILDAALVEARRYIVASDTKRAALVLWSAHTHLVHSTMVDLQRSPRLAIQSRVPGSGKTTSLEFVAALSFRGVIRSSATASTILRTLGLVQRTYCLDEADRQLSEKNSDMVAILDCGDRRSTSLTERSVKTPNGDWVVGTFNVWGAVAFAGIDELPGTLQDRSVRVFLHKATVEEVPEHLRDGTSTELVNLRRQLSAWADGLFELPDPALPDVLLRQAGRVGDRWRPLIAIAALAGGQWPDLAKLAAMEDVTAEGKPTLLERLLIGIHRAFENADPADKNEIDNKKQLTTPTLIGALLADREEEWLTINRSKPITPYFLREKLRDLLDPPGTQDWWTGPKGNQQHHSGYLRLQFETAWRRYTPSVAATPISSHTHPESTGVSGVSGVSGVPTDNLLADNDSGTPDGSDAAEHRVYQKRRTSAKKSAGTPDTPDAPDAGGRVREKQKPAARVNGEAKEDTTEDSTSFVPAWIAADIRDLRAKHPRWKTARIAREVGQPVRVVEQVLGAESAP